MMQCMACSGEYDGDEDARLGMLRQAAVLGAPAIDVEYAASESFNTASDPLPDGTTLIMSNHNFESTPSLEELQEKEQSMRKAGAHVAKLAMTAEDISDAKIMLDLLKSRSGVLLSQGSSSLNSRMWIQSFVRINDSGNSYLRLLTSCFP